MNQYKRKSKKRQHRCRGINEYRSILFIYNPTSAHYFRQRGWQKWMEQGLPFVS